MRSRSHAHVWVLALLAGVLISLSAAAAAQAAEAPGIEKFAAVNCSEGHEQCAHEVKNETLPVPYNFAFGEQHYSITKEPTTPAEAEAEGYLQAGGHVPYGVTDFKVATTGSLPKEVPTSIVEHIRTDVAPGLATSPAAVPMCSNGQFGTEEIPGSELFTEPKCSASTKIGVNQVTVYLASAEIDLALEGFAYNLEQPKGRASNYGVAIKLPKAITEQELKEAFEKEGHPLEKEHPGLEKHYEEEQWYSHTLIEGNVEWGTETKGTDQGDYHDYFEIKVSPALPLISSRLLFYGRSGQGDFITNATSCPGHNTTTLTLTDLANQTVRGTYTTPVGLRGCKGEAPFKEPPFFPGFSLTPGVSGSDQPDPLTTEFTIPQHPGAEELETAQVDTAGLTLPEGMTLNPSAAAGLEDCTTAQARIHSEQFGVECPSGSELGTVTLNVPGLPEGSLIGKVYLGGPLTAPETGPITGPPYIIYVVANSVRYGVSVRIKGEVKPNETTGQLTTVFDENPEQPFTNLKIEFNRNVLTAVANPLMCGTPEGSTSFTPYTAAAAKNSTFGVSITGCGASLPFSLGQVTEDETSMAGAHTSYDFTLTRKDGEQYLSKVKTTLPEGLIGAIPDVVQCGEPQAAQDACGSASRIGTATVAAGAGNFPFSFSGPVYLTGPYNGAPFGLLVPIEAAAGPFNLGKVVTRATININPTTARVTSEATLPTIVKGVPIRLRSLSVDVTRQGFLDNPTNCSTLATESSLTSTSGTVQSGLSSPFQVEGCGGLAFKPTFTASTSGKHSKANGASLVTTLTQLPGQANVKSVLVTLPKALPSRLTTLQKACLAKVFEANPYNCTKESPGSEVGTATAVTPTLPGVMKGPAYLVSHGGEAFPSLELVLESNGVRVILEGKTNIKNGITTTNFESTPDVPVSSVTVNLPMGPHSALTTEKLTTNLCTAKLVMATKIVGQNGKELKQNTTIAPTGCGVQIVGQKVVGNTVYLTIKTFAAGRISAGGSGLKTVYRTLSSASNAATLKVPLNSVGLGRRRPFSVKVRVGFVPKKGAHSSTTATVKFRR